jgi:hypothetical protein
VEEEKEKKRKEKEAADTTQQQQRMVVMMTRTTTSTWIKAEKDKRDNTKTMWGLVVVIVVVFILFSLLPSQTSTFPLSHQAANKPSSSSPSSFSSHFLLLHLNTNLVFYLAEVFHGHLRRHVVLDLHVEKAADVAREGARASPVHLKLSDVNHCWVLSSWAIGILCRGVSCCHHHGHDDHSHEHSHLSLPSSSSLSQVATFIIIIIILIIVSVAISSFFLTVPHMLDSNQVASVGTLSTAK